VPYNKGGAGILSLENLSYYALHLVNHGISFLYTLLFAGLIIFVGTKALLGADRRNIDDATVEPTAAPQAGYLWAWLLIGYMILTLVPNKGEERYAQPLLPPIALIISGAIMAIGSSWVRRTVMGLAVIIGGFNYLGLTYGLPGLPPRLSFNSVTIISHEYPHYNWVRSKILISDDYHWPISTILSLLADWANRHEVRAVAALRTNVRDRVEEMSIEEEIRMIYLALLQREPGKRALQKDVAALRAGSLTRDALIDTLIVSPEFKNHRSKVLVVLDHPQFNASTLRYYAEVDGVPLSFSHILEGPITTQRLQEYELILVKDAGYQGPEFSTRYTDQIHESLLQPGSGFVLLPERFPFPDHSHIVIFVALSLSN
jgi:hypothetical protein